MSVGKAAGLSLLAHFSSQRHAPDNPPGKATTTVRKPTCNGVSNVDFLFAPIHDRYLGRHYRTTSAKNFKTEKRKSSEGWRSESVGRQKETRNKEEKKKKRVAVLLSS